MGAGQHTLVCAPTGSGKTLAGFVAAIDALYVLAHCSDRGPTLHIRACERLLPQSPRQTPSISSAEACREGSPRRPPILRLPPLPSVLHWCP
jgi:hypothetical protein